MGKLRLVAALGHYDHVTDLVTGRVPVKGAKMNYLQFSRPAEIHFRFIVNKEFDVAEMSLGKHASLIAKGEESAFVGLPVFTSRVPRHSSIYIRRNGPIQSPKDLAGKRIGIPEWAQTAAIYTRGLMAHQYGIDLRSVEWVQAGRIEKVSLNLPPGIRLTSLPSGNLSDMLVAGELDAVMAANAPQAFRDRHPNIGRLFEDFAGEEQSFVGETGIFPIMHLIALRADVADRNPWLAMNLLQAFEEAKNNSVDRALRISSAFPVPWAYDHARTQQKLFGADLWPYGLGKNRKTLDAFLTYAFEQGVCSRRLAAEELFAPQVLKQYSN